MVACELWYPKGKSKLREVNVALRIHVMFLRIIQVINEMMLPASANSEQNGTGETDSTRAFPRLLSRSVHRGGVYNSNRP